ncbi:MAG: DNA polymerase I, partial [Lachnospiraceae bacterium]|nr:DNA polymerase I [Lachnospiraceae bacterium]
MSGKIVLIDGHSILNRAFYGVPDLTNSEGIHTNAVYGFLNIMFKILEQEKPEYLTVAFDVKKPTFRHEMYPEYKGTRKGMPDELREQVPVIQEVLKAMGVCIVMQGGYEADDILGTIARKAEKEGKEVTLVSGDRDLLQLASDKIKISIPKTKKGGSEVEEYHTQEVIDKYSVTPAQIIDLKGLMGDTADNIPGVPGVGEKTAVKILAEFPSVEEAYENIDNVMPKRAQNLLRENKELAILSKKLATIKTDCDIDYEFEMAVLKNLFTPEAFEWVKKLELKSIIKKFDSSVFSEATVKPQNFLYLNDKKAVKDFVAGIIAANPELIGVSFAGDEWSNSGVEKKKKKKSGAQLSFIFDNEDVIGADCDEEESEYNFVSAAFAYQDKDKYVTGCVLVSDEITGDFIVEQYKKLSRKIKNIALFDLKNTMHLVPKAFDGDAFDICRQIRDVKIGAYLLNPLKDSYFVDDIARDYLGMTIKSYAERFEKKKLSDVYNEVIQHSSAEAAKSLSEYAGSMACVACMSWEKIAAELNQSGMSGLFDNIEMPTAYYLYQMEKEGVKADRQVLEDMSKLLQEKILALETDIYDLAGEEFNINSPKQLGVILFEKLKLPFAKKTKTGYSTSADILEKLRTEDPIVDKILDYRQLSKLKSTYADGLVVFIEDDKRIHGKFNQTITATGRISSTEPNLQNIPIRMELGRQLRKVFVPKEGYIFLDADYSQIELRVLAHMSGDEELINAYKNGDDIHRSTASKVFHTPFDEVTDIQRRNAKAVNFGIVYGISAFGLS